ncbi:MAG: hypothetical protein OQJ89_12865 [Kangiellaceae bacterium]|nr:hypothetical protein [Kangiellaceae bacterium]MCW9017854.1 hypothetical protein [Kangiellaceae bacterium]
MKKSDRIIELIEHIVCEHSNQQRLKELCFVFRQDGSFTIGGRQKLIEELVDSEYDSKCIHIIFACSSDFECIEGFEKHLSNMNELKTLLESSGDEIDLKNWLAETVKDKLAHSIPSLREVSYIDYRTEQSE